MGRKRSPLLEAAWRKRLTRFKRSKMTISEFCEREGVSEPSFYNWRKRLGQTPRRSRRAPSVGQKPLTSAEARHFVPVEVLSSTMTEIELPNGMKVCVPAANIEALRTAILAGANACKEAESC